MCSVDELKFKSPFTMMIAGPSGSGKTYFVRDLLHFHDLLISGNKKILNVIWAYGQWQDLYKKKIENVEVEYFDGLPSESELKIKKPDIIVIDDLMNELADDAKMGNLFTKGSHHMNINVIFITQNLFHKGKQMRNISLSCHYLILMKNPRDSSQIDVLGRQMKKTKVLEEAFKDATNGAYGYLLIDFKQDTKEEFMLRTNIFPIEGIYCPTVYISK